MTCDKPSEANMTRLVNYIIALRTGCDLPVCLTCELVAKATTPCEGIEGYTCEIVITETTADQGCSVITYRENDLL